MLHKLFARQPVRKLERLQKQPIRFSSCTVPTNLTEQAIEKKLREKLKVESITVHDQSGSGGFFYIHIESPDFNGLSMVKQHQLVNEILKDEFKKVHGISLKLVPVNK